MWDKDSSNMCYTDGECVDKIRFLNTISNNSVVLTACNRDGNGVRLEINNVREILYLLL